MRPDLPRHALTSDSTSFSTLWAHDPQRVRHSAPDAENKNSYDRSRTKQFAKISTPSAAAVGADMAKLCGSAGQPALP
jgi:hypothetical protein